MRHAHVSRPCSTPVPPAACPRPNTPPRRRAFLLHPDIACLQRGLASLGQSAERHSGRHLHTSTLLHLLYTPACKNCLTHSHMPPRPRQPAPLVPGPQGSSSPPRRPPRNSTVTAARSGPSPNAVPPPGRPPLPRRPHISLPPASCTYTRRQPSASDAALLPSHGMGCPVSRSTAVGSLMPYWGLPARCTCNR